METIKFLKDAAPKNDSGQRFKKGQVVELSEASCRHWVNRGVARFCAKAEADDLTSENASKLPEKEKSEPLPREEKKGQKTAK